MDRTITLDEPHFRLIAEKARVAGKTPVQYLQALIDADGRSFDEILGPVRGGFDSMKDEELDALLDRANQAARESK